MFSSESWTTTLHIWQQLVSAASTWLTQLPASNWDTNSRGHWQRNLCHLEKLMPKAAEGAPDWGTSHGSRVWKDGTKGVEWSSLRLQDTSTKGQSHRSLNLHSKHCANLHHHSFPHTFPSLSYTEICSKAPRKCLNVFMVWTTIWIGKTAEIFSRKIQVKKKAWILF